MTLPPAFRFPQPGFWAVHAIVIPAVFGGGVALGIFHASGHGAATGDAHGDAHATHAAKPAPPVPAGSNPIREEMIALQAAYDLLQRGVVLGDANGVAEAFHKVHGLKQATSAAIEAGTAKPPKNGDRIQDFVARDEAFHALLGTTVEAAGGNDIPTLRRMTGELQASCIACHEEFRGTP